MKPSPYRVHSFVMKNGERYRILVHSDTGLPVFYPNLYATTQIRCRSLSVKAMEGALASINVLLSWCETNNVDLEDRFVKSNYLQRHELDSVRDYCQHSFASSRRSPQSKVIDFTGKRTLLRERVKKDTEYKRLTYIAQYVEWLAHILATPPLRREQSDAIKLMKSGLDERRPTASGRNTVNDEKSLENHQLEKLITIIDPLSDENPYRSSSVRIRNKLLFIMLLNLGVRIGELLSIRVRHIDWDKSTVMIARQHDDKTDPRVNQPVAKTLDRILPMKASLTELIRGYIVKYRRHVRGARNHDFLFVTHKKGPTEGWPLSVSSAKKVIATIKSHDAELQGVHAHAFRHTWNYLFSESMDAANPSPTLEEQDDQAKTRSYLQGWKQGSGTAARYNKRFIRQKSMDAALRLQNDIVNLDEVIRDVKRK
ncbi:site-specific integrase [Citrobacter braakii]